MADAVVEVSWAASSGRTVWRAHKVTTMVSLGKNLICFGKAPMVVVAVVSRNGNLRGACAIDMEIFTSIRWSPFHMIVSVDRELDFVRFATDTTDHGIVSGRDLVVALITETVSGSGTL